MSVVTPPQSEAVEDLDLFRDFAHATGVQRERLQEAIVARYTGLVKWIAGRYVNPAVDREELEQVGFLGLVLAIQRFDPERGSDFVSFARPTVQGEIRRYFRDKRRWIRLPRRVQTTKAVLAGATEKLTHQLGRAPTVAELAAELAVDEEIVLEAMTVDDHFTLYSLDTPTGADDHDAWTLADTIGSPDPTIDLFLDCRSVAPALAQLSERDRTLIELRFFHEMTQAEIGQQLGYSQMHVSRMLARVLGQLRESMQDS
ncbi:MAG TPA: SigB/SigF/SigG family RNA polymerase sigma factor [Sporichthyaceae bacterium]|jgi:RNA polymerase sigma-B factor